MSEKNTSEEHFINKTVESNFALWNALLTVNGIMLTAFSIVTLVFPQVNKGVSRWLVVCCGISLLLLVWNFLATKHLYLEIGRRLSKPNNPSEKQKTNEIKKAEREHENVQRRETAVLFLLLVETVLIGCLLVLHY